MEKAMLKEKAQEHQRRFNSREKDVLMGLRTKFREKEDYDDESKVKRLLQDASEVDKRIDLTRNGKVSTQDIGKTISEIEKLAKKREKLLSKSSFKKKYAKIKERLQVGWEQQELEQSVRLQEEKAAAEASAKADTEKESFRARRAKQLKVAGHPAANNLKFASLRPSEHHVVHRWKDRGLTSMTLQDFLAQINDARILYTLEPCEGDKGQPQWEVKVQRLEEGKQVALILNREKTTIITVLRDDDEYDYKRNDHSFAPAGKIAAERATSSMNGN
ncbi:expressed unknown protein [Seminavis robusta]|uniref:Uncharacterized protein n=1 Tax=Seminavis robusta TaxID=568900 RepID=A0A9N8DMA8_9STRA|nr:expressed unknown protein [Seminavis robusta]|eukprot:Sro157_g071330.1 n/a (275) ;mRNA; f:86261-87085